MRLTHSTRLSTLWMGGKSEKSNMMQDSTVYRMDGFEEDKEEVEGTVDFDGGDEVNYLPFVYPRGTVSVSSSISRGGHSFENN